VSQNYGADPPSRSFGVAGSTAPSIKLSAYARPVVFSWQEADSFIFGGGIPEHRVLAADRLALSTSAPHRPLRGCHSLILRDLPSLGFTRTPALVRNSFHYY